MRSANRRRGQEPKLLEHDVVSKVKAHAKKLGWLHRKIVYVGRHGAPDDWFFNTGARLVIIEFKRPGGKPTDHQDLEISRLRDLGFKVYVIDDIQKGKALFDRQAEIEKLI